MSVELYPNITHHPGIRRDDDGGGGGGPDVPDGVTIDATCAEIREALSSGRKVDEGLLASALGSSPPERRAAICARYGDLYGESLGRALGARYPGGGDFGEALRLLALPPDVAEAKLAKAAASSGGIFGGGGAENHLYSLLCGRSNGEMSILKRTFSKTYGKNIEEIIDSELRGDVRELLFMCVQGVENEFDAHHHTDERARSDADDFHEAVRSAPPGKHVLFRVLCSSPPKHLGAVDAAYQEKRGRTLSQELEEELEGSVREVSLFLLGMKLRPHATVAALIKSACVGMRTDETLLTSCVVRYQPLMGGVMAAHRSMYGKTVQDRVQRRTGGKYRALLLRILDSSPARDGSDPPPEPGSGPGQPARVASEADRMSDVSSNASQDDIDGACKSIHDTCRGKGRSGEKRLIRALGNATQGRRAEISARFKELHGEELAHVVIKSKYVGAFGTALRLLVLPPSLVEAKVVKMATLGRSAAERHLYPIVCGRSKEDIDALKRTFLETYGKDLGKGLSSLLTGDFRALLVASLDGEGSMDAGFHTESKAHSDAIDIYTASQGDLGADKGEIFKLICQCPSQHLAAVNAAYEERYGHDLFKEMERQLSGAAKEATLFTLGMKLKRSETIARLIKTACVKAEDLLLTACIIRYQPEMQDVVLAHMNLFGKSLQDRVKSKTSGHHRALLLSLIGAAMSALPSAHLSDSARSQEEETRTRWPDIPPGTVSDFTIRPASWINPRLSIQSDTQSTLSVGLRSSYDFGADVDTVCISINDACRRGWRGADEKRLIEALGSVGPSQRARISLRYEELYQEDLSSLIEKNCSGFSGTALALLAMPFDAAEAKLVNMAASGYGAAERHLYPILCGRSNSELELKTTYLDTYGKDLGEVLVSCLSGDMLNLLTLCINGAEEEFDVDFHTDDRARSDAEDIYFVTCKGSVDNDNGTMFRILRSSPPKHLNAVNSAYEAKYGLTLFEAFDVELKGAAKTATLFLLGTKLKPYETVAHMIKSACVGIKTDELLLTACIIRYQPVMRYVELAHMDLFGKSVKERIESRTSGNYKALLLEVLDTSSVRRSSTSPSKITSPGKPAVSGRRFSQGSESNGVSMSTLTLGSKVRPDFGGEVDEICKDIKEACKQRWGRTDEKALINALVSATPELRGNISARFKELYGRELKSVIKDACSGALGTALQLLSLSAASAEAKIVRMATSGYSTVEKHLYPIICGRSNEEIDALKRAFFVGYGKDLEEILAYQTQGDLHVLLMTCLRGTQDAMDARSHTDERARSDADDIYSASQGVDGNSVGTIAKIICSSTPVHLESVNSVYGEKYDCTLYETLDKRFSGAAKAAALFALGIKLNPLETISQLIKSACVGIKTDELLLTACMIRYQPVMIDVMLAHKNLFDKTLKDRIESKTSGNYKYLLTMLLGTAPIQKSSHLSQSSQMKFVQTVRVNIPAGMKPGQWLEVRTSAKSTETNSVEIPKRGQWLWDSEGEGKGRAFFITTITGSVTTVAV